MVSNSLEALTQQPVISPLALRQLQHTKHLLEEQLKTIDTLWFPFKELHPLMTVLRPWRAVRSLHLRLCS